MKLLTKEIIRKAQKQYPCADDMNQKIVAKFFDPVGSWSWYMMNLDTDEDYAWGIVKGWEVEIGSFSIEELKSVKLPFGLGIERDKSFVPITAKECYDKLRKGEHV